MTATTSDAAPEGRVPVPARVREISGRVREWIRALHRDPTAEERAMEERRAHLLEELNRAVAEAPDDVPIRYVVDRLNHHPDD